MLTPFFPRILYVVVVKAKKRKIQYQKQRQAQAKEALASAERYHQYQSEAAKAWIQNIRKIIFAHRSALIAERRRYTNVDAYGNVDTTAWSDVSSLIAIEFKNWFNNVEMLDLSIKAGTFDRGFLYFWANIIVPQVGGINEFISGWRACQGSLQEVKHYRNWADFIYKEIEDILAGGE